MTREEVLRFALLITLTIALASVAFRIDAHPSAHHRASAGSRGVPRQAATAPHVLPTETSRPPASPRTHGPAATARVAVDQPILPVTGWDGAVKLAAVALVLIGGGASLRAAGSRQPR